MAWPLNQDYNEAIQEPRSCLSDPELRAGEVVRDPLGLPRPRSGTIADVYEIRCPATGSRYAIKCFLREVPELPQRYQAIGAHLRQARLPFTVDFSYLEKGIQIRGQWYPILKMPWVEGLLLNQFVHNHLDQPALLEALLHSWVRLGRGLSEARLAHADLQHANVLVVPGSAASAPAIKLIDYDGMIVPALAGRNSGEAGHPAYQHPQRLRDGTCGPEVDRFSLLVVAAALRCLAVGGRALWERYDTGNNLLFRTADLHQPEQSVLFADLRQLQDPLAVELVNKVAQALTLPLEQTPLLEEPCLVSGGGSSKPACPSGSAEASPSQMPAAEPSPAPPDFPKLMTLRAVDLGLAAEPVMTQSKTGSAAEKTARLPQPPPADPTEAERSSSVLPLVIGGVGVALLALLWLAFWFTHRKPADTSIAQANTGDDKPHLTAVGPRDKDRTDKPPDPLPPVQPTPVEPPVKPPVTPVEPPVTPVPMHPMPPPPPGKPKFTGLKLRYSSPVRAVALSRDGQVTAAGCADGTVSLRTRTGEAIKVLKRHTDEVRGLAFLPDGKMLASVGRDGFLRLGNIETGAEKWSVAGHSGGIVCLAVSADGLLLATGGQDRNARLWDATGKAKGTLIGHRETINALAFSPDGKTLATVSDDRTVRLWETDTGDAFLRSPPGPGSALTAVAFSPDGKALAAGGRDGVLVCFDLKANRASAVYQQPAGSISSLAWSADGRYLAVGGSNGIPYLRKGPLLDKWVALEAHGGEILSLGFAGTGDTLLVGGGTATWVWKLVKPPVNQSHGGPSVGLLPVCCQ